MTRRLLPFLLLLACTALGQDRMSPELLWKLGRLGGGVVSPDGKTVVYSVRRYDLAADRGDSDLWSVPIGGGQATRITSGPTSEGNVQFVQTAKGLKLFFTSVRGDVKTPQVYCMNPDGSDIRQVSFHEGGVSNLKVSPTGKHIAFTTDVKMDKTVNELFADLPKADARIIDDLMYRHWAAWHDYAYSHLHVAPLGGDLKAGEARDLMAGLKVDCPVPPFGGAEQFNWSPDGAEIALTMKMAKNWAESTDSDVYLVKIDGDSRMRCITAGMNGYDNDPVYSPDGRWIAFHSMERPGFESDRNRIMLYDRKNDVISELTVGLDQTTHSAMWTPDSKALVFYSERLGTNQIFSMDLANKRLKQLTKGRFNWNHRGVTKGGTLLVGRQSMLRPWELGAMPLGGGEATIITDVNGDIYAKLKLPKIEERWVRSTDGKKVHNWVIYPPDFDPGKKWPMLTYCQGGPQGQIGQWFSYRWNFHLMAAQGYVVTAVNRRGLPGFGRAWNDEISKDWGGQAMQDILAATDDMLTEPYIDRNRVGAIGASFGGYTAYWLMGNHEKRFATMISHCGVFNLESMYGSTEELFFVNWDMGGPYWKSKDLQEKYDRFSPHRFVKNWDTPLLVIHGQKDFRVPVTQGMEAFTAAKVQGVPARFLYYPNEGHWVLRPQNGVLWHRVFFDWLARTCGQQ